MDIASIKKGNAVLMHLKGRMDVMTSLVFDQACDKLILGGDKYLVIDLEEVEYISSAGLRSFLGADKKIKAQGGKFTLFNLKGMVKEVFHVSGFAVMFPIFDTAEAALEACR